MAVSLKHLLYYTSFNRHPQTVTTLHVYCTIPHHTSSLQSPSIHNTTVCCIPVSPLHPTLRWRITPWDKRFLGLDMAWVCHSSAYRQLKFNLKFSSINPLFILASYLHVLITAPTHIHKHHTHTHTHRYPKHSRSADGLLHTRRLGVQRRCPPQTSQAINDRVDAHNWRHSLYTTRSTGCIGKVRLREGSRGRYPNQRNTYSGLQDLPLLFHRSI